MSSTAMVTAPPSGCVISSVIRREHQISFTTLGQVHGRRDSELIDPLHSAGPLTHEVVASLLDPPDGGIVADLGAGLGNFTALLEQSGYNVIAVDIDEDDYREAGHSSAPFVVANLDQALPELPGPLTGAVAIEVIEHLENPLHFLRSVADGLVEGGWLIVTTPNVLSLSSRLEFLVRGDDFQFSDADYRDNGHISPVSGKQLDRIASRVGLVIEATTYNVGRIPLPQLRKRVLLRGDWARSQLLGEALIVKFRKRQDSAEPFTRG
jgi:2-polyprenyl-3-methyl-5-hydroxy-6-metoxy-1,4-benzoquinol methylase